MKENIVVDGGDKLGEVKSDHTGFEVISPPCMNKVGKEAPSIFSGVWQC
jgi:hypothetical protein